MVAVTADLFVGSIEDLAAQSFTTSGGAASLATGDYYLYHTTTSLSLLATFQQAVIDSGVTGFTAKLRQDMKIAIAANSTFSITWGSATTLRDLLGFTADDSGSASYVSDEPSPVLFSPGWPATTPVIENVDGYDVEDTTAVANADFSNIEADHHNTGTFQEWEIDAIAKSRNRSASATLGGNTYYQFRRRVLVPRHRFFWYEDASVDFAGTADFAWPTGTSSHGPYKARAVRRDPSVLRRTIKMSNDLWGVRFEGMLVGEYA